MPNEKHTKSTEQKINVETQKLTTLYLSTNSTTDKLEKLS